jgi:hypothetical protein
MKRFIIVFSLSAFLTAVFLAGMKHGSKSGTNQRLEKMLSSAVKTPQDPQNPAGEDDDVWVNGIKTKFSIITIPHGDLEKAADDFAAQFNSEGLIADIKKNEDSYYVSGVNQQKTSGKGVTLVKKEDGTIMAIPSSHELNIPETEFPEIPETVRNVFGSLDFRKVTYSRNSRGTMMIFICDTPLEQTKALIMQKMQESGYAPQSGKATPDKNMNLFYFAKENRECFFELTPVDDSRVRVFTADYSQ